MSWVPPNPTRSLISRIAALVALVVVSGSVLVAGSSPRAASAQPGPVAPSSVEQMSWAPVPIGGGGWMTGLVVGPSGEVYARSDVGGAYRWVEATRRWEQMIVSPGVPDPQPTADYRVESIAVAPSNGSVVYVAVGADHKRSAGRVLRSDDGGRTWRDGGQRFAVDGNEVWRWTGERLSVDPLDPDTVVFGTRADGLWKSRDGGGTWQRTSAPHSPGTGSSAAQAGVMFTLFEPGRGTTADGRTATVWAGSTGVGILRSDDAGETWSVVHAAPTIPQDAELGPDGSLFVVLRGSPSKVVRIDTTTFQVTEITPPTRSALASVAVDPHRPGRLFVAESGVKDGSLWRSTDGGGSWTSMNVSLSVDEGKARWPVETDMEGWMSTGEITFDPTRPGLLWFAEGMGVWRTTDLDHHRVVRWQFASDGIEELVSNDAVKPAGGDLLTAHWDRPVFRHPGDGVAMPALTGRFDASWDLDVADGDPSFVVAVVDDNRFCCEADGLAAQSGFSTDGGRSWQRFGSLVGGTHPAGLKFGNIAISSGNRDHLVWVPSRGGAVHHSTDRGATWKQAAYPGGEPHYAYYLNRHVLVADPVAGGTFYVLDRSGFMRSTDGGATWQATAGKGLPPSWARRYNAIMTAVPGRQGELLLTLGPLDGASFGLFRSTDGGQSWTELAAMRDAGSVDVGPAVVPGGPPAIYAAGAVGGDRGVWRSDDEGRTWTLLSRAPGGVYQSIKVLAADPEVAGKLYVGFSGNGFMVGELEGAGGQGQPKPPGSTSGSVLSRAPGSPFGHLDVVAGRVGAVEVAGWAIDPDVASPVEVHVYVDGAGVPLIANGSRPDVGGAFAGYGPDHGFGARLAAAPGAHQVCAHAINVGAGTNTLLGCRVVTVPTGPPFGHLDVVAGRVGAVEVAGWAIDPDVASPVEVHVYVDGAGVPLIANGSRPDVGGAFAGYGPDHGFGARLAAAPGAHQVCAHAINVGAGTNTLLGCRVVTVPTGPPFGHLDVVAGRVGAVEVAGWAIDPDVASPVEVHVYVDGAGVPLIANGSRPDVGGAFAGYGPDHGFGARLAAAPGAHQVCAHAINVGAGTNTLLGCRVVTVR